MGKFFDIITFITIIIFGSLTIFAIVKEPNIIVKNTKKWNSKCVVTGLYVSYHEDHHTTYEYKYAQVQDTEGYLYDVPKEQLKNARMHDTIMVFFSQYNKENIKILSATNLTNK